MTSSFCGPNDLVIAISGTGRTREVIEAVELAKHYRAKAIGITAPNSELAAACDVRLTVEVPEYPDALKPLPPHDGVRKVKWMYLLGALAE